MSRRRCFVEPGGTSIVRPIKEEHWGLVSTHWVLFHKIKSIASTD